MKKCANNSLGTGAVSFYYNLLQIFLNLFTIFEGVGTNRYVYAPAIIPHSVLCTLIRIIRINTQNHGLRDKDLTYVICEMEMNYV